MQTKAVILMRVSDYRQEKEGLSLDNQEEVLRNYAAEHDFVIAKVFRFQETADQKIRTRFMEMIKYVKKHSDVKAIVSYRVDRLTRNYRDHVLMDELRQEHDKELHCVHDRLVINKRTVGRDIQDWDTKAYLAKQYLNRLKEDAFNTAAYKLKHGQWPGKAPYGYRNKKREDKRNWIYPQDFEAGIVRQIYLWYAHGDCSMRMIRKRLMDEMNISTSVAKIDQILHNRFYYGEMLYDGEVYPHVYEPIISRELFDQVQDVKAEFNKKPCKYGGLPFLYRGTMRCGVCGCSMTPERKHKKGKTYNYYHCTQFLGKHDGPWLREEALTAQFEKLFLGLHVPADTLSELVTTMRQSHQSKVALSVQMTTEFKANYDRFEKRIAAMYEDKLDGLITEEQFKEKRNEYRGKQSDIEKKLRQVLMADDDYYDTAETILELASRSADIFRLSNMEEKRALLKLLLQNCTIEEGNVLWELKNPYASIFENAQNNKWLRLIDMFRQRQIPIDPVLFEMRPAMTDLLAILERKQQLA